MDNAKILKAILTVKGESTLRVGGISMMPVLCHGQTVTVRRSECYAVGDVLVYAYKNEGLLAHRLLKVENGRYFCKGDNSFRVEDVTAEQILGRIDLAEDANNTHEFIVASLEIGRLFRAVGYDIEKVKATPQYEEYKRKYLRYENDEN